MKALTKTTTTETTDSTWRIEKGRQADAGCRRADLGLIGVGVRDFFRGPSSRGFCGVLCNVECSAGCRRGASRPCRTRSCPPSSSSSSSCAWSWLGAWSATRHDAPLSSVARDSFEVCWARLDANRRARLCRRAFVTAADVRLAAMRSSVPAPH